MRLLYAIGLDVVEIARIVRAMERHPERFLARILTPMERAYCCAQARPATHVAARWAAKEALYKALCRDRQDSLPWQDVEVLREPNGPPRLELRNRTLEMARLLKLDAWTLSLSHTRHTATAVVAIGRR